MAPKAPSPLPKSVVDRRPGIAWPSVRNQSWYFPRWPFASAPVEGVGPFEDLPDNSRESRAPWIPYFHLDAQVLPVISGTTSKSIVYTRPVGFRLFQRHDCVTRNSNGRKAVTL